MKYLIKFYTFVIFSVIFSFNSYALEKIKIGLVIPLSGQNKELGESVLKSVRLAINDINDDRIQIIPRDNRDDPDQTLEVSRNLYDEGVKIIIGPIFKKNTIKLNQLNNDLTFLSFTNKISNSEKNIISTGVNSISQFNAIKKFQVLNKNERSFLFAPNTDILEEINFFMIRIQHLLPNKLKMLQDIGSENKIWQMRLRELKIQMKLIKKKN